MRAHVSAEAAPLTLTDRPVPTPGRDEALVRTRAASLDNAALTASGEEHIAGFEFAGEVLEVGADAPAHLRGAHVMGIAAGAFAEVVVAHHRHVVVMPEVLSFDEAATLPTALTTEHGALALGRVGPATSVLITAATSGLGLIGIQVAVTSRDDLAAGTKDATGGEGAQVVLDHVGGDDLADAIQAACDGGEVISVGRLGGARGALPPPRTRQGRAAWSQETGRQDADDERWPRRHVRPRTHGLRGPEPAGPPRSRGSLPHRRPRPQRSLPP
jgi:NADPH2:quinone reductase